MNAGRRTMDRRRSTMIDRRLIMSAVLGIAVIALSACEATTSAASSPLPMLDAPALPTRTPAPTADPPTPIPSPTLAPTVAAQTADGWQPIRQGIAIREMPAD